MLKRAASILLCLLIACGVSGCTGVETEQNAITIQISAMEGTLDPAGGAAGTFNNYAPLCIDPLVSFDEKGNLIYEAAEAMEVNECQTVWVFHLRENGRWSDGSPVTAEDFVNTIHRALQPDSGSHFVSELSVLEGAEKARAEGADAAALSAVGVEAVDDFTLKFTLGSPCPYFLKLLVLPVYAPSKAGVAAADHPNWYTQPETHLGNGAFYMTEYKQDEAIVLHKNPYYHQAERVKLNQITLLVIPDNMAAVAAYYTGEADVASGLLDAVLAKYEGKPDLYSWDMQSSMFMQFSLKNVPELRDVRVRRAFALGISRENLCAVVGSDIFPSYSYVAQEMISNCSDRKFSEERPRLFEENLETARQLLAEAGYPGGRGFPVLTYRYPNNGNNGDIAVALQAQLKKNLGLEIKLEGMETGVYYAMLRKGDYELIRNSWTADYTDPINYLSQFRSGSSFAGSAGIADSRYDELIGQSNAETDPVLRNALLHEAEYELVAERCYVVPLYSQIYVGLRNPEITGIERNDRGESLYRFSDIGN